MNRKFTTFKLGIIFGYLALVAITLWWVFILKPTVEVATVSASVARLPAGGSTLLIVTNDDDEAWTDVDIVIDGDYIFHANSLEPGAQLTVNSDGLANAYFTPYPWDHGTFSPLASRKGQPGFAPPRSITPASVTIKTAQGVTSSQVSP